MISSIFLYALNFILGSIAGLMGFISHGWSVWPSNVLDGLTYFFTNLMNWNFLINTYALLQAISSLIKFLIIYVGIRLALKLFNWMRGAGGIDI